MRRAFGTAIGLVAVVALTACGSSGSSSSSTTTKAPGTATASDGEITIYSGQHEQTVAKLTDAFTAATGIKVKVRSADEATLADQILQEGSSSPADVFYAENPPALNVLDDAHLLGSVATTTLDAVDPSYRPDSGHWVGTSARAVALAFNTGQTTEAALPGSILDLTKPEWKGKVGFAPTETDFQPIVTTIVKQKGAAFASSWLDALKANGKVYSDNEALIAAVDRGEIETGIVDHYYWYRLRDEVGAGKVKAALHYFAAGDPGALVDVSGAAPIASGKHPKSTAAFLAFLVGHDAQTIIATSESYEYPIAAGVQTTKVDRPLSAFGTSPMTISELGDGKQALELLQKAGLL